MMRNGHRIELAMRRNSIFLTAMVRPVEIDVENPGNVVAGPGGALLALEPAAVPDGAEEAPVAMEEEGPAGDAAVQPVGPLH